MFEELAWRHYKVRTWGPMIRTKFRLRFQNAELPPELSEALTSTDGLAKAIFRTDRTALLKKLASQKLALPITLSNIVFVINRIFMKDDVLKNLENEALCALLDDGLLL
jgi:hypothetical protein